MNDEEMRQMIREIDQEIDNAYWNAFYCILYLETLTNTDKSRISDDMMPKLEYIRDVLKGMRR